VRSHCRHGTAEPQSHFFCRQCRQFHLTAICRLPARILAFADNLGLSCWLRATQRPCDVCPLSRYIWARLSRAVTWRQLSHRQSSSCRQLSFKLQRSRSVQVVDCHAIKSPDTDQSRYSQVACGALLVLSIFRSPAAGYSRFSSFRRARVDYHVKCASHGPVD
jgi:hypothetical protein